MIKLGVAMADISGGYDRDGNKWSKEGCIPHLYLITPADASVDYPSGWYFCDEAEQINGPFVNKEEAARALDLYVENM